VTLLLDSNVLIAFSIRNHAHHQFACTWVESAGENYASCPITQGALVRFAIREGASAGDAAKLIRGLAAESNHEFWPDDLSFDQVNLVGVIGHRQVTDSYLAALARSRNSKLATFDRGLAAQHSDVAILVEPE
jgi:toxin-antitoxin system PIN domain toxin